MLYGIRVSIYQMSKSYNNVLPPKLREDSDKSGGYVAQHVAYGIRLHIIAHLY